MRKATAWALYWMGDAVSRNLDWLSECVLWFSRLAWRVQGDGLGPFPPLAWREANCWLWDNKPLPYKVRSVRTAAVYVLFAISDCGVEGCVYSVYARLMGWSSRVQGDGPGPWEKAVSHD